MSTAIRFAVVLTAIWGFNTTRAQVSSGMTLVGQWDGHIHLNGVTYGDVWAEKITSGRFKGRTFAYLGHWVPPDDPTPQGGVDIIDITDPS